MRWFVMLRGQREEPMLLVDEEDQTALFDSKVAAIAAAERNPFGEAYGYEVYEWWHIR